MPCLHAQPNTAQSHIASFDATNLLAPADLGSTWLVSAGDDPAYARPDFDDSRWRPFDPHQPATTLFPTSRPSVIWYRQRIRVNPAQTDLALSEQSISHAFEVYVNGERLIASGQVAPYYPSTGVARVLRPIPDRMLAGGTLLIALRVHISQREWDNPDQGFYAGNLTIGQHSTLYRDDWLAVIGENLMRAVNEWLLFLVGLVAIVLFIAQQRGQIEYLWIFVLGVISLAEFLFHSLSWFHDLDFGWQLIEVAFRCASPFLWVSMYFAFVHIRIGRRFRIYLLLAGLLNGYSSLRDFLPGLPQNYQLLVNLPFVTLLSIVIPIVLIVHLRRGNREAGILLIPMILFSLYIYTEYTLVLLYQLPIWRAVAARGLTLIDSYPAGPFSISLDNIAEILSTASLAVIMLLRTSSISRQQALLEGELAAAREVQQLILPDQVESIPGFKVESAYEPAQQVGGDFFQVLPADDGGLLFVLGDVAGKGLPAAMLVSVLVGSIRTAAEDTHAPEVLLRKLNDRLIGRSRGGFSTALAAHFSAQGKVTIANAGHLSPYLDGREIELPGALPLGIAGGESYQTTQFDLTPGARLTFYSDGVVEAQNPKGELLGFARAREISTQPAAEIVAAAKKFGQSDDITVVAITRLAPVAIAA